MARIPRHTARDAAHLLGHPQQARTFARRAREAYENGDERVEYVAKRWIAPMSFWREVQLREAGRPKGSRNRYPYGYGSLALRWLTDAQADDTG